MSHMAAIDLHITDIDDLEAACKVLGLELVRNQTNWKWFGSWVDDYHAQEAAYHFGIDPKEYGKCAEHVITVVGADKAIAYEIGVVRRRDGKPGWMLMYDFFGSGGDAITRRIKGVGEDGNIDRAGKLKQEYTALHSYRMLRAKGFDARIITQKNGHRQTIGRRTKVNRVG